MSAKKEKALAALRLESVAAKASIKDGIGC